MPMNILQFLLNDINVKFNIAILKLHNQIDNKTILKLEIDKHLQLHQIRQNVP